jgi:DNA-binding SARP family transcriptional activator
MESEPILKVWLLGGMRAELSTGHALTFPTRKCASLLAHLCCSIGKEIPRESLYTLFWPGADPACARNSLSVALSNLRKQLEGPGPSAQTVLECDNRTVRVTSSAWSDLDEFRRLVRQANYAENANQRFELLCRALDVYQGPLLVGDDEPWAELERFRLEQIYLSTLCHMLDLPTTLPEIHCALNYATRALTWKEDNRDLVSRVQKLRQKANMEQEARYHRNRTKPDPLIQANGEHVLSRAFLPVSAAVSIDSEPKGGAVRLDSPFYVVRETDTAFKEALLQKEGVVLLKGPRQSGKTSLLARGAQAAREAGAAVAILDLAAMDEEHFLTAEAFHLGIKHAIKGQLNVQQGIAENWDQDLGAGMNLERFVRQTLDATDKPIVIGLDEVERLFRYPFAGSFFGLLRSWYNRRALEPGGPWSRLTMAITYATEAHLFIKNLNQSPFNVGIRFSLCDFDVREVADLNRRYGLPLKDAAEFSEFMTLLGGHPQLVRMGLSILQKEAMPFSIFQKAALADDGPFANHLHLLFDSIHNDHSLTDALKQILDRKACPSKETFYRLRAGGLVSGDSCYNAKIRCALYEHFLRKQLRIPANAPKK